MTYAELKALVLAMADRPEIEQQIPGFIAMAEAELSRSLRVRRMMGRATASLDNEFELLPEDFAGVRTLELAATPRTLLEPVGPERLASLRSVHESPGEPVYFAVVGREIRLVPRPASAYPGSELTYWRRIPALSDDAPSNWLLEVHPDAYLYGALKHAGQALGDPRTEAWTRSFEVAVAQANAADPAERGPQG